MVEERWNLACSMVQMMANTMLIVLSICLNYCTLPNKCAHINKHTPDFWIFLAISRKLLNRSQSNLQHWTLRYSEVQTVSFLEIRQGSGFVFCLYTQGVYSVKYGICNAGCRSLEWRQLMEYIAFTVFRRINAPGAEAQNEALSLSDLNETSCVHPPLP